MPSAVLDSYAVLAFLFKDPGWEKVSGLLENAVESGDNLLIAAPNWAEACYMIERKMKPEKFQSFRLQLLSLPLNVVPADQALAENAAGFKCKHRMSLADCFAAALAQKEKLPLYTGDPEFKAVEREIKIVWL